MGPASEHDAAASGAELLARLHDLRRDDDDHDTALMLAKAREALLGRASSPTRIGRFTLLGRLGRGGMGTVYDAYDPDLDRRVAVKVLRAGSDASVQRLLDEGRALARLGHPHVVAVYEVGFAAGELWVAMERVLGPNLRTWMHALGQPRPWREVVDVLLQVGGGLAAAHAAGVRHGDVKPDNVIVADDGRTRVVDFGVARIEADGAIASDGDEGSPLHSRGGGTPAYLAPEQREGAPVTLRADQYAFAVMAFEALHLRRPERAAPSWRPGVPRRVRRVLERALSLRPEERFGDMEALLVALRRARRGPVPAFGVVVLGVLACVVAWAAVRAPTDPCPSRPDALAPAWSQERRDTLREHYLALSLSEPEFDRVAARLDVWSEAWLRQDIAACRADDARAPGALGERRRGCLADRRRELGALVDELAVASAATLLEAPAAIAALEQPARCGEPQWLANASVGAAPAEGDDDVLAQTLAHAAALRHLGSYRAAVDAARLARARAEPDDARAQVQVLRELGLATYLAGERGAGEAWLREAVWRALSLGADESLAAAACDYLPMAAMVSSATASLPTYRELATAATARAGGSATQRLRLQQALASAAMLRVELPVALEHLREAEALQAELPELDALERARLEHRMGTVLRALGEPQRAEALLQSALERERSELGDDHPMFARTLAQLGVLWLEQGRMAQAGEALRRALAIREQRLGDHDDTADALHEYGTFLASTGDFEAAVATHRRAIDMLARLGFDAGHDVARAWIGLGNAYYQSERPALARDAYQTAIAALEQVGDGDGMDAADAHGNLGGALLELGDLAGMREHNARARAIVLARNGPDADGLTTLDLNAAIVALELGELDEARRGLDDVIARLQATGATDTRLPHALWARGRLARAHGDADARARLEAARAVAQAHGTASLLADVDRELDALAADHATAGATR